MTTTYTETPPLTKRDLAALRKADDVYAVLHEGKHLLRAIKRPSYDERESDPFATDQRIDIPVEGRVTNYEKGEPYDLTLSGFVNLWHSTGIWEIAREGDRIHLDWVRGNYGEWMKTNAPAVGVDHLTIRVLRTLPSGRTKEFRFLAAYQAGAKNSARLIRSWAEGGPA